MKALMIVGLVVAHSLAIAQDHKLPATWGKDFVIKFAYTGSMDGSQTQGRITYDSCTISYQAGHKAGVKGYYKMKESDRVAILKKLHEFKADQIKSENTKAPVDDGYSKYVLIGDFGISGGSQFEMKEDDRMRFGEVYAFLEGFALRKTNPK